MGTVVLIICSTVSSPRHHEVLPDIVIIYHHLHPQWGSSSPASSLKNIDSDLFPTDNVRWLLRPMLIQRMKTRSFMCDENIQIQSNVNTIPRKKYTNANQKNKYAYQNTPKHQGHQSKHQVHHSKGKGGQPKHHSKYQRHHSIKMWIFSSILIYGRQIHVNLWCTFCGVLPKKANIMDVSCYVKDFNNTRR